MNNYDILFEDKDILIINKKSAIPVQKAENGVASLEELIRASNKGGNFLEAVHRIDQRASGIVVFARNETIKAKLDELFRDRLISKTYFACTIKKPKNNVGELKHFLTWDQKKHKAHAYDVQKSKNAKKSSLDYALVFSSDRYYFLKINLHTGRAHQIRAQLAAIGCPIKGDLKYGAPRSNENDLIMLHAYSIEFYHPVTKEALMIKAPFPDTEQLWSFIGSLV